MGGSIPPLPPLSAIVSISSTPPNGRRFIDGDVSLGDILPIVLSEVYALLKKGKYQKYFDFENWNFVVFESIFNNKSYLDLSKVLQEKKVLKSNELTASPF